MKRVLIVDDEIAVATVFEAALKGAGYDVKLASDAKSGLSAAQAGKFDLILMDQMMPDMSGNEALKTLKADPSTSQVPVAMLTNFGHDTMVKEALNAQAADYILKYQVSNDGLVERVKGLIGESGAPSVSEGQAQVGGEAQAEAPQAVPSTEQTSPQGAQPQVNPASPQPANSSDENQAEKS